MLGFYQHSNEGIRRHRNDNDNSERSVKVGNAMRSIDTEEYETRNI